MTTYTDDYGFTCNTTRQASGVSSHITHKSGRRKTVCTSAVLAAFGIDASQYKYSQCQNDIKRLLNKFGWSHASRKSAVGITKRTRWAKMPSVGKVRKMIAKMDDGPDARYYVSVPGHAMLLDAKGKTIVDTAPRRVDRRKVLSISVVRRAS